MFDGMSFDDINKLHSAEHKNISMPYEQYFGEMALTDEQIERRIETARSFEDAFIFIASLMFYMVQMNAMNYDTVYEDAAAQYRNVLSEKNIENTDYFSEYHVPAAISEIIDTTVQNPERTFNYSYDRVMLIAENEANAVWNDAEFQEAIEEGFTDKTWHAIIDKRTRDSHRYLDGKTIPITEPYEVGEYLMMYPKDESLGAGMEEIAGCRCSIEFGNELPPSFFGASGDNSILEIIDVRGTHPMQHGFSCFGDDDTIMTRYANILKPKEDYFDVAAHGTAQMICFGGKTPNMGPSLLADLIKRYPTYHGEKIRLLSCNTGNTSVLEKWEYCFAEELSNIMGVTVEAPDDFVYYRNDGTFFVGVPQKTDLVSFTPNQRGRFR